MKDKKELTKYCFIHMKDEPVVYGNLSLLLHEYSLDREDYFGKQFPFEVGGHLVYRKKMKRGTIAGQFLYSIVNELKDHKEYGSFIYEFDDDFENKIKINFFYSGGKFKIESFECKTKEGFLYKTPLTTERIEKVLNESRE